MVKMKKACLIGLLVLFLGVSGFAITTVCLPQEAEAAACQVCRGSGNSASNCHVCNGKGRLGNSQCGTCKGTGWLRCGACNGSGQK